MQLLTQKPPVQTQHLASLHQTQNLQVCYRLAKYYLGRLRAADLAYRRGHTNAGESLSLLNQDWAQIAQWQSWAASQKLKPEIAQLCAAFPQAGAEVLITRQTPQERIHWL